MAINDIDLFFQARDSLFGDGHVIAGVVADFESVLVELRDLFPGEVIGFVGGESEPFGNKEGGVEAVFLEDRADNVELRGDRIVEGEDDQFVGDGFEGVKRGASERQQKCA